MVEVNNKTKNKIDSSLVKSAAESFLKFYKREKSEVSIAFVGDKTIQKLNRIYRGLDQVTDVLAFPETRANKNKEEDYFLGEIIINYTQIKRQARKFNNTPRQELLFILVHGLLHLLGHSDKTKRGKEEMGRLSRQFIRKYY